MKNNSNTMIEAIKNNIPKGSISDYFNKSAYIRVLRLAKTPDYDEFSSSSLRVILAIFIIGLLGFLIFEVMNLLPI